MRTKSHQQLGHYLVNNYMNTLPKRYVHAFLLGCIEPDKNPATYLKGSLRRQWLRGHNWENAQIFMERISRRLEKRNVLRLIDYYTLGKLIHYTTDAFTSAHNSHFNSKLAEHKLYEAELQKHFLEYLSQKPAIWTDADRPAMETIQKYHAEYLHRSISIHTDTRFAIIVCSMVVARIMMQH